MKLDVLCFLERVARDVPNLCMEAKVQKNSNLFS